MRQINAIIVDDEDSGVHALRGMLDEFCPLVKIVYVANTVEQGVFAAVQLRPQVVFLDIEMPPHGNGFEFLRQTEHLEYGVVFTTAHAHYAVQAINTIQPWAYLVKPYKSAELVQAVQVALVKALYQEVPVSNQPRGIILSDMRKGQVVVRYTDLICCVTDNSCSVYHFYDEDKVEQLPVYKSMREIEAELPAHLFCRVHHGAIVNMAYVRRFERVSRSGKLLLASNIHVEVSSQKMDHFAHEFGLFLKGSNPVEIRRGK